MATTETAKNATTSPAGILYNIRNPNHRRGMFSLRQPFKNMPKETISIDPKPQLTRALPPPVAHSNRDQVRERIEPATRPVAPHRQVSKRNAEVQCSLLMPHIRHEVAVQTNMDRERSLVVHSYDDDDDDDERSPRYRDRRRLPALRQQEKVYEIWDADSPRPRARRMRRPRDDEPIIDYLDDDEELVADGERIIYANRPRGRINKSYLPSNVRMICVRDDANRTSY